MVRRMARPSHVRDAVETLLRASDRHDWTAEELHRAINGSGTAADFSSVFRAVRHLSESGTVAAVEVAGGATRYEFAVDHHEHAQCGSCGSLTAISGCLLPADALAGVRRATGFVVDGHQLLLTGRCASCATAAG